MTWGAPEPDETEIEVVCLNCLIRPPRPGSVYCSRLCRWLDALRKLGGI